MNRQIFNRGYLILTKVFQDKSLDAEIMWDYLCDLSDDEFKNAIDEIIDTVTEVNKSTNIIALIRERAVSDAEKSDDRKFNEFMNKLKGSKSDGK